MTRAWRLHAVAAVALGSLASGNAVAAPAADRPVGTIGPEAARAASPAPSSRIVVPAAVHSANAGVTHPAAVLDGHATRLQGTSAQLVLDFGRNVAGVLSLRFGAASDGAQQVGVAFTESVAFVGHNSDASNGSNSDPAGTDGYLTAPVTPRGTWTAPVAQLRGAFRYVTVFPLTSGWVDLDHVSVRFTAAPNLSRPDAWPNYFSSSDSLLNRIWYAGGYTLELDTIAHDQGRATLVGSNGVADPRGYPLMSGWANNAELGGTGSLLTDGAKRDRAVWPGDFLMAFPSDAVSLHDMSSVRAALEAVYRMQTPDGAFTYEGPPAIGPGQFADAYHLDTLVATAQYLVDSGDRRWLDTHWSQYLAGLRYAEAKTLPNGVFVVTGPLDWARSDQGGINLEANALMYRTLTTCVTLAGWQRDAAVAEDCRQRARQLKAEANNLLWDDAVGAYRDSPTGATRQTTPLYPQDGNSLAVWFGMTQTPTQRSRVLTLLRTRWTRIGATTPEWNGWIHPFPGGMEVMARFEAGDDGAALDLVRREWGHMLTSPLGTRSTFWEGYHPNGDPADYYNGGFPASYTSLAHGWATAPTAALTSYLLGASTTPDGYRVAPHPGGVRHAEGTLTTPAGQLALAWTRDDEGFAMTVRTGGVRGTGTVAVPLLGHARRITVNGSPAWDGRTAHPVRGVSGAASDGRYVTFRGVTPGSWTFRWH
jgi:hypothetical protein